MAASVLVLATAAALRGMSLEQAITTLEERDGISVIFSSALVKPWMRVRTEPTAATAEGALAELVAPFGLRVRETPRGIFAVVRAGPSREPTAAEADTPSVPFERVSTASHEAPLREVVIAANRYELTRNLIEPSTSLSATDIEHLPDFGDDALRAVARLPGTTTNGLSARSHVRGGEASETLVRLDGVRLYNPFHLKDFQSIFSAIDPRIVSTVDVYTGGFDSRFGDRISGVLDIASLTPPAPRYREINVSFLNTSFLSAGRFADDRGEWVASLRRGNIDVWYSALRDTPGTPRYSDAFGKVSWQINPGLRATAGTLLFNDEISLSLEDDEERASADYKDRYYWLRLDHQLTGDVRGTTWFSRADLHKTRAGSLDKEGLATGTLNDDREFTMESFATEWAWRLSETSLIELGGEITRARGAYRYQDEVEFDVLVEASGAAGTEARSRNISLSRDTTRHAIHATFRSGVTSNLVADIGARWESHLLGPRVGIRYQLAPATFFRAAWARVYQTQGVDELDVADGDVTEYRPQQADHLSAGLEHRFGSGISLRVDAYEKRLRHLRPRYENLVNPLTVLPELSPDRIRIEPEIGRTRGLEVLLAKKDEGPLTWWLGYTWSSTRERIDGVYQRRSWDQPNALSAGLGWSSVAWSFSAALIHRSGWPVTGVSFENAEPVPILHADPRNQQRVPLYRSLDVRIERRFSLDRSSLTTFLEITNLLGRDNQCCSAYEVDEETGALELEPRNYMPRLPSLGFLWQF